MKRVLLTCWMFLLSAIAVSAQDFTSLFLKEHEADTMLTRVTISPKMMEEILKSNTGKDEDVLEIISNLKSMQVLSSSVTSDAYYQKALKIVEDNPKRFQLFLSYEDENENCRIIVRKKGSSIVELIMLIAEENRFVIINFTGNIKPEFISTLTKSMTHRQS